MEEKKRKQEEKERKEREEKAKKEKEKQEKEREKVADKIYNDLQKTNIQNKITNYIHDKKYKKYFVNVLKHKRYEKSEQRLLLIKCYTKNRINNKIMTYLNENNLRLMDVFDDGHCLFRTFARFLYGEGKDSEGVEPANNNYNEQTEINSKHWEIRKTIVDHVEKSTELQQFLTDNKTIEQYKEGMLKYKSTEPREIWGGELEIKAFVQIYDYPVVVIKKTDEGYSLTEYKSKSPKDKTLKILHTQNHYITIAEIDVNEEEGVGYKKESEQDKGTVVDETSDVNSGIKNQETDASPENSSVSDIENQDGDDSSDVNPSIEGRGTGEKVSGNTNEDGGAAGNEDGDAAGNEDGDASGYLTENPNAVKTITARLIISKNDPNGRFEVMEDPNANTAEHWLNRLKNN